MAEYPYRRTYGRPGSLRSDIFYPYVRPWRDDWPCQRERVIAVGKGPSGTGIWVEKVTKPWFQACRRYAYVQQIDLRSGRI